MNTPAVGSSLYPWLQEPLSRALNTQRGHALLVHGPAGIGQFEFALELARAWLCETPEVQRASRLACGHCASCHLVDTHVHPDLRVLLPEVLQESLGWSSAGDIGSEEEGGKKKAPSKEIKVEQVRAVLDFSELTRGRGQMKVVVVFPAERMNHVAANALLKTLEEPAGDQRFVLASPAADRLLPTVRSRCQAVRLTSPAREQALHWLATQALAGADTLLDATGERPVQAVEWSHSGVDAKVWGALPEAVHRGDVSPFTGWPLPRVVDALQRLCHDTLCLKVGAAPRYFKQLKTTPGSQLEELLAWSADLSRLARQVEHPWNASLLIESLVTKGRQALR